MSRFALIPNNQFKRDVKKQWAVLLTVEWAEVAYCLINDLTLPAKYRDHELRQNWAGFRECHVQPDLLLIYEKGERDIQLVRLGSYSELFG